MPSCVNTLAKALVAHESNEHSIRTTIAPTTYASLTRLNRCNIIPPEMRRVP